jgi:hypothetical protein
LIEDYIPIESVSAEAGREKSIPKGHISPLHLWWARRLCLADPGDEKSCQKLNQTIESITHWGTEYGGNWPGHALAEAVERLGDG